MHEIVTLQVGRQSNYLATHFWNVQESYFASFEDPQQESLVEHDILFRAGTAPDGTDTFTPRTVIYDFKKEFGTIKKINELYDVVEDQTSQNLSWASHAVPHRLPAITENDYQRSLNLGLKPPPLTTQDVRFWSDYNRVFYHPRSVVQVYETDLSTGMRAFEHYSAGEELFSSMDKEHDLLDRDLRLFVEECDQMQGIQLLTGVQSAWAGFSARYLDRLRDEYGRVTIWTWGINDGQQESRTLSKLVNETRAVRDLVPQSSIYIPLTGSLTHLPSYTNVDLRSPWHLSAVQAAAFESMTLPSRLRRITQDQFSTLGQMSDMINVASRRNIAQLHYEVDFEGPDAFTGDARGRQIDLFPDRADRSSVEDSHKFSELEVCRGIVAASSGTNGHAQRAGEHEFRRISTPLGFPILDSFPGIYPTASQASHTIAIKCTSTSSTRTAHWIHGFVMGAGRRIAIEDREDMVNGLEEISEAYQYGTENREEDSDD